ncbi:hypothetical protein D9M69_624560 [compost metagenome]
MKQSGFETALLVDPVNDLAIGGIAANGVAKELADTRVIVLFDSCQQFGQTPLENIPMQMICMRPVNPIYRMAVV